MTYRRCFQGRFRQFGARSALAVVAANHLLYMPQVYVAIHHGIEVAKQGAAEPGGRFQLDFRPLWSRQPVFRDLLQT
jgi:hypothetical protein